MKKFILLLSLVLSIISCESNDPFINKTKSIPNGLYLCTDYSIESPVPLSDSTIMLSVSSALDTQMFNMKKSLILNELNRGDSTGIKVQKTVNITDNCITVRNSEGKYNIYHYDSYNVVRNTEIEDSTRQMYYINDTIRFIQQQIYDIDCIIFKYRLKMYESSNIYVGSYSSCLKVK